MTIEEMWQQYRDEALKSQPMTLLIEPLLRTTFYASAYATFAETLDRLKDLDTASAELMKLDAELNEWAKPHLRAANARNN